MRIGCWVLLVSVVGCVKHNSKECNDGICSDAELPFCDGDGSVDGTPNTCIAVSCSPAAFEECRGDQLITCNADGTNYDVMTCATGCDEAAMSCRACTPNTTACSDEKTLVTCGPDGTSTTRVCDVSCVDGDSPHCAYAEPKYLPDVCDAVAPLPRLDFAGAGTFDTGLDTNCNGGIVAQASAADICVVRYGEISIASDAIVNATGPRVLALIADDSLSIAGVLDGGAKGTTGGPGGGFVLGAVARGDGAGFRTAGGAGGSSGAGGLAQPNPATQDVIYGGTRAFGTTTNGGGAVILTACRGTVSIPGTVTVGGGGGLGDLSVMGKLFGGFGGGSGGNVVVQGLAISISGQLFANGGGGGGGVVVGQVNGTPGSDGLASDTTAAPGGSATAPATAGGTGAVTNQNFGHPGSGATPGANGSGGGGGGSQGFLQTYTPNSVVPDLAPSHASPAVEQNGTIRTR